MAVHLITDSTSDVTPAEAQRLGVEMIPLKVIFGQDAYREAWTSTCPRFISG